VTFGAHLRGERSSGYWGDSVARNSRPAMSLCLLHYVLAPAAVVLQLCLFSSICNNIQWSIISCNSVILAGCISVELNWQPAV
jgi:hypothetical protein